MEWRYQQLIPFEKGAQAQIWKSVDSLTGAACLIKAGPRVHAEALLALDLNHPFIVSPVDLGSDAELGDYAVYPELRDRSLLEAASPSVPSPELQRIVLQVLEFLSFLHNRGWLYHDFKPEHFRVGDQQVRVIDFGLCERAGGQKVSGRFSGTFPFISPERMMGRPYDHRSDLFALGMMLLRCLTPDQKWDLSPGYSSLMKLMALSRKLTGLWGKIVAELLSLEPQQRPASAEEVWKRLLPAKARRSFLFFPMPGYFHLTDALDSPARVLLISSPSRMNLLEAEKQILRRAWTHSIRCVVVDFPGKDPDLTIAALCALTAGKTTTDVYEAIHWIGEYSSDSPVWLMFRTAPRRARQKAILKLLLAQLARTSWARAFVLSAELAGMILDASWKRIQIPSISPAALRDGVPFVLPSTSSSRMRYLLKRSFQLPEELIEYLGSELPDEPLFVRPAASLQAATLPAFDSLSSGSRKVLFALALAGGSAPADLIRQAMGDGSVEGGAVFARLAMQAYIARDGETLRLNLSPSSLLSRLRANHRRQIASRLRRRLAPNHDRLLQYYVSHHAGDSNHAAIAARQIARQMLREKRLAQASQWLWRAFKKGASLPVSALKRMATYFLRQSDLRKAAHLIAWIGRRRGRSKEYFDLKLGYYHKQHKIRKAIQCAIAGRAWAERNAQNEMRDYFQARKAGLLILNQELDAGEELLNTLAQHASKLPERILGLVHHFYGLLYFYRGRLRDSVQSLRKAVRMRHNLRATTVMNLGTSYAYLKESDRAEKWLSRAIRVFQRKEDAERLGHAFNNIGVVYKQSGRLVKAREAYTDSAYLGQACRNANITVSAITNLATLAEMEGRTSQAILYRKKALRAARKAGLKPQISSILVNMGLLYAILGEHKKALSSLRRAINLREEAGAPGRLGDAYENLGLSCLLIHKYPPALEHLGTALDLYGKADSHIDAQRVKIYIAIAQSQSGMEPDLLGLSAEAGASLEYGLYRYLSAIVYLNHGVGTLTDAAEAAHDAERAFRRLPSLFWLAKLLEVKAEILHRNDLHERALVALQAALGIYSRIGARAELLRFGRRKKTMKLQAELLDRMAEKLPYKLLQHVKEILATGTLSQMITRILGLSLEFSQMERAVLVLQDTPPRIYESTSIAESEVQEICEICFSAIQSAIDTEKPFVCNDAAESPAFSSRPSIVSNRIMSIICLPLRVNDRTLGVLYMDSKEGVEAPASTETTLLEVFGSIVALALNGALALERSMEENTALKKSLDWSQEYPEVIGSSPAHRQVLAMAQRLINTTIPVLLTGETGTGKELIARILHYKGAKREGPFIAVNCSALSKDLLESELFGHEKGAFTGAINTKPGLFEQAVDGTLFLDEVAEMPIAMQAKILRAAQEGEYRRVGGRDTLRTNARLIFATNRNLEEMVRNKQFREDLYYRIRGVQLKLPSLKERREDIPQLAETFLANAARASNRTILGFTPEAIDLMMAYEWPGNIRQLKNEMERIVALTENDRVQPEDFDSAILSEVDHPRKRKKAGLTLREIEKDTIQERLKQFNSNVALAAKSLGLSRHGLYSKMKRYRIPHSSK